MPSPPSEMPDRVWLQRTPSGRGLFLEPHPPGTVDHVPTPRFEYIRADLATASRHAEGMPEAEALAAAVGAHEADPLDANDRPSAWQKLDAMVDAAKAVIAAHHTRLLGAVTPTTQERAGG